MMGRSIGLDIIPNRPILLLLELL